MKNLSKAFGLVSLTGTLAAFDYRDPEVGITGPADFASPVLHDTSSPLEALNGLDSDTAFAHGEQALRVLEAAIKAGGTRPVLGGINDHVSVNVRRNNQGYLEVSGDSEVNQRGAVYMDDLILLVEGCKDQPVSTFQWVFTDETHARDVSQFIITDRSLDKTVSSTQMVFPGMANPAPRSFTGPEVADRAEAYTQLLKRVACLIN